VKKAKNVRSLASPTHGIFTKQSRSQDDLKFLGPFDL
jgi:hypothetical protein